MQKLLFLLAVILSALACFASSWQQVAELNVGGGELVDVNVSPSGNTVVVGYAPDVFLYEKPETGWANASKPTTVLTCSDPNVMGIGGTNYGVATDDVTVVAEGFIYLDTNARNIGIHGTSVLLVWQEPANGWGSQSSVSQSFELQATGITEPTFDSVAIDAQTIAVGAAQDGHNQGAIFVWDNPPQTYYAKARLTASDGAPSDQLGWTLSISGNTITTGSCPDDGAASAIYVFVEPPSGWTSSTQTAELTYSPDSTMGFGCYVASNGNTIATSAVPYDDYQGRIDIFTRPASGWSNSSTPTAQLTGSSKTGRYFGDSVHLSTNVAGDDMIVSAASVLTLYDAAEDIYYKPLQGWGSIPNQQPSQRIDIPNQDHWDLNGLDGVGVNTVVFATCGSEGCESPINVYQYK